MLCTTETPSRRRSLGFVVWVQRSARKGARPTRRIHTGEGATLRHGAQSNTNSDCGPNANEATQSAKSRTAAHQCRSGISHTGRAATAQLASRRVQLGVTAGVSLFSCFAVFCGVCVVLSRQLQLHWVLFLQLCLCAITVLSPAPHTAVSRLTRLSRCDRPCRTCASWVGTHRSVLLDLVLVGVALCRFSVG